MLTDCATSFQFYVHELADKHGKTPEQVYSWWREYCETCRNYDQSPVQFEFEAWYANQLSA